MKQYRFAGIVAGAFIALAAPGFAQDQRVEINPFFGYTFSDGVTVTPSSSG